MPTPLIFKCKGIQDCLGFQIPRHGFRIPGIKLHSLMEDLGFRTSIVSEIPDSKANDSGFHRQNYWSRIPESTSKTSRIPDSRSKTSRIPDSTSKASRSPESGFSYMGRSVPGVTPKDWGQRNLWDLPTPSNEVTAPPRKLQRMYVCMYVCRPATLSSRSRPYSQYPAWCSLQTPERVYKLLCGVFNRKSWSATSYFSATSVYSCHGVFKG